VTVSPIEAAGQEFADALLEIVEPPVDDPAIPLKFNPAEYQLSKTNNFAEIAIPGLESPPLQWVRGGAETLSMDLLVDTSGTLEDVRVKYVDRLRGLLDIDATLHAPPIVRFTWDAAVFTGVLESLATSYTLFDPQGVPLRARLTVSMKEYRPAAVQVREEPRTSPTVDKVWVVGAGDTLSGIAAAVYKDAGRWRVLAEANAIADPRALEPGRLLTIPRLV
jgi:nucleoid-associated protein YgaU